MSKLTETSDKSSLQQFDENVHRSPETLTNAGRKGPTLFLAERTYPAIQINKQGTSLPPKVRSSR